MNSRYNKAACLVTIVYIPLLFIASIFFQGCATTGTIAPEIIQQSAAVDTSISELQTQQATSAQTVQAVSDTTDEIEQTAKEIKNDKLSEQASNLKIQVKSLNDSLTTERNKTAQIQAEYSALKVSSGTEIVNQSTKINKLTAQLKLSHKWNLILGGIIVLFILASVFICLAKFYFKK